MTVLTFLAPMVKHCGWCVTKVNSQFILKVHRLWFRINRVVVQDHNFTGHVDHNLVIVKTSLLTWCIQTCAQTCENWGSIFAIEVARKYWQKHPYSTIKLCAFRCPILNKRLQNWGHLSVKVPLSQKLLYFRERNFSQCFILSTALQCLLPSTC